MVHKSDARYHLRIGITVVSSTRSLENDVSGLSLERKISEDGYAVTRTLCRDDEDEILGRLLDFRDRDVIIFVGGTGPSRKDVTYLTLKKVAEKEVFGFGELFRSKSENILAYLSDASLFIVRRKQIYCIPGSPDAVEYAWKIIKAIMNHVYEEVHKE